jgi:hypothetical protein
MTVAAKKPGPIVKVEVLNIFQKLLAITEEIENVAKNLTVGIGTNKYKGVAEADVLKAVKPAEIKYGVYSYPMKREIVYAETFVGQKPGYKPTDPPKNTYKFVIRLKTTYRFVNVNDTSQVVDQEVFSDGEDPMDKAPGKAMTYGDKFALLKAYKIFTGEDTENDHSKDTTPTDMKPYKKPVYKKPPATTPPPAPKPTPSEPHVPEELGKLSEEEATEKARMNGLGKIMTGLGKPENMEFKDEVVKNLIGICSVESYWDIQFTDNMTYKKFIEIVAQQLEQEKTLKDIGI